MICSRRFCHDGLRRYGRLGRTRRNGVWQAKQSGGLWVFSPGGRRSAAFLSLTLTGHDVGFFQRAGLTVVDVWFVVIAISILHNRSANDPPDRRAEQRISMSQGRDS